MFKQYRDIVTVVDLQTMLGIGRNMAYDLLQSGAIYSKRCGKRYIIPKSAVIAYLSKDNVRSQNK